jgi:3-methyladenine DNA glycosylase Tag
MYVEGIGVYRVLVGKPEGKNNWGDPVVDGKMILRWIFREWDVRVWTGLDWLRIENRWRAFVSAATNFWVP